MKLAVHALISLALVAALPALAADWNKGVRSHMLNGWLQDPAEARTTGEDVTVNGYTVYLGLAPADSVRHNASFEEKGMHGTPPAGATHVTIAVYRAGARPEALQADATVETLDGRVLERHPLEPMHISGTVTWGNYFRLPREAYRIRVSFGADRADRNVAVFQRLN